MKLEVVRSASLTTRDDFLEHPNWKTQPPVIARSSFVPVQMVEHLMRNKKDSALGVKYCVGDAITNMEGLMHTFVTPIAAIKVTGDYMWRDGHGVSLFGGGRIRRTLLCAAIQPDFETADVMYQLCRLRASPTLGQPLPADFRILSAEEKASKQVRERYETTLCRHLVHHLSRNRCIPALGDLPCPPVSHGQMLTRLEALIVDSATDAAHILEGVDLLYLSRANICIEVLFQAILHQLKNEYSVYRVTVPQGVVDVIDPPQIFVRLFGGDARLVNRLKILAFKYLALTEPDLFAAIRVVGFNDFADEKAVDLLGAALKAVPVEVVSKDSLFQGPEGWYSGPDKCALVVKNNSDAFGQNIETEGPFSSLDGAIGSYSDAACVLNRTRPDLLTCIFTVHHDPSSIPPPKQQAKKR